MTTVGPLDARKTGSSLGHGFDVRQAGMASVSRRVSLGEPEQSQPQQQSRSFGKKFADAYDTMAVLPALDRMLQRSTSGRLDVDPTTFDDPEFVQRIYEGIPDSERGMFSEAINRDHAILIREQILKRMATEQRLAQDGFSGVAMSMLAATVDPVSLAVGVASSALTGPIGAGAYIARGAGTMGRIARAERAGSNAMKVMTAARAAEIEGIGTSAALAARSRAVLRSAAVGGGSNALIEGMIASTGERDVYDVMIALGVGAGLSGGITRATARSGRIRAGVAAHAEFPRMVDEDAIVAMGAMGSFDRSRFSEDMTRTWQRRFSDPEVRRELDLPDLEEGQRANIVEDTHFLAREAEATQGQRVFDMFAEELPDGVDKDAFLAEIGGPSGRLLPDNADGPEVVGVVGAETEGPAVLRGDGREPSFFHGTANGFDQFDPEKSGGLIHFTDDELAAQNYGSGLGGNRDASRPGEQLFIDDDGYAYERRGDMAVPVARQTDDGRGLEPLQEGHGVEPLRVSEVEQLIATMQGGMVKANARVIGVDLDVRNALDLRPNGNGQTVLAGLDGMGNQYAERVIDNAKRGETFNWRSTRSTTATKEWKDVLIPQLRALGYDGLRFVDDSHPTTAVFDASQVRMLTERRPFQIGGESPPPPTTDTQAATDPGPPPRGAFLARLSASPAQKEGVRFGMAASASKATRATRLGRMFTAGFFGDTLRRADGSSVGRGILEQMRSGRLAMQDTINRVNADAASAIKKRTGRLTASTDELDSVARDATAAIRAGMVGDVDASISAIARPLMVARDEALARAKYAGVRGAEAIVADPKHMPVVWSAEMIHQNRIRSDAMRANLTTALEQAYRNANDDWLKNLDSKKADTIVRSVARMFQKNLDDSRLIQQTDTFRLNTVDSQFLREVLETHGTLSAEEADSIVRSLELRASTDESGVPSPLKHRTALDYEVRVMGEDGTPAFALSELMEQDARILTQNYVSQLDRASAQATLVRAINAEMGTEYKSIDDIARAVDADLARNTPEARDSRRDAVNIVNDAVRLLKGAPLFEDAKYHKTLRIGQNLARATFGGSFGVAQMPETAVAVSYTGLTNFAKAAPAVIAMRKGMIDGTLRANSIYRLLADAGVGRSDNIMGGSVFGRQLTRLDDVADAAVGKSNTLADKVERGTERLARLVGVASGQEPIERAQRSMVTMAAVDWMLQPGRKISRGQAIRFGLSDAEARRIEGALEQWRKDGILSKSFGMQDLDVDAAFASNADAMYLLREAIAFAESGAIQRHGLAGYPRIIAKSPILQALWQFRGFATVAYERQLLLNIDARDARSAVMVTGTLGIAAMGYMAQETLRLNSIGASRKEREEALAWDVVARTAIRRAGFPSLLPDLAETADSFFGNPLSGALNDAVGRPNDNRGLAGSRNTGLTSSFFNPGSAAIVGLGSNYKTAMRALVNTAREGELTQDNARRMIRVLPAQNQMLFRAVSERLFEEYLPE